MGNQVGTITYFVKVGDLHGVRYRLEAGDDIDERKGSNYTPLIAAAYLNNCEMIDLLLDKGADIEAVESSGLTALRTAIYYKNEEAAIKLAQRGAEVNKIGYQQKTDLRTAVEQGQIPVVKALLLAGADTTLVTGGNKTAADCIKGGLRVGELWDLLKTFESLSTAIEARNSEAVAVLLKRELSNEAGENKMLEAYNIAKRTMNAADGVWETALNDAVDCFDVIWLNYALRRGSTDLVDAISKAVGKPSWISTVKLDLKGSQALHVAASQANVEIVCHLLAKYECDPVAVDDEGRKPIDFVVGESGAADMVRGVLTKHEHKILFILAASQLQLQETVTASELHQLLPLMTSIYDLRAVCYLAFQSVTTAEMKLLLKDAFAQAVRMKLMFDHKAAVFFKGALRECRRLNYISTEEKDKWNILARNVNVKNSDWVREIQQTLVQIEQRVAITENCISSLQTNFKLLCKALEERDQRDAARARRQRLKTIVLVSCPLLFFMGELISTTSIFDVLGSADVLTTLTDPDSENMAINTQEMNACRACIEKVLVRARIEPTEFTNLLKDAIKLEKTSTHKIGERFVKSPERVLFAKIAASQPTKSKLRFQDVVELVKNQLEEERSQQPSNLKPHQLPLVDLSHLSEGELEMHPYHFVVYHSFGDVEEFKVLVKHVGDEDGDVDATMEIRVPRISTDVTTSPETWDTVQASPATFASYLGYVGIVEWILETLPADNAEKNYVRIQRARSITKQLQTTAAA